MTEATAPEKLFRIRPAARLIHTIGSDLIGDPYAALVELVKNSYDADASSVDLLFQYEDLHGDPCLRIIIQDTGHGMTFETIRDNWLVPATNRKLKTRTSPKGRILQGRKGIGRFAASILGQEMTLHTTDERGNTTTVIVDWESFKTDRYLEEIEILIETKHTGNRPGTRIELIAKDSNTRVLEENVSIESLDSKLSYWNKGNIENLEKELRKLVSPLPEYAVDDFAIKLRFIDCPFPEFNNKQFDIEAYPIIELYDYRISGVIDAAGKGRLKYENNVNPPTQLEEIDVSIILEPGSNYCGILKIDFRVFDRDPEAIGNLINKGLIDPISQKYAGRNEAKKLLNEVYGVNIYRNNFRIKPYGNGGIDWLDLDKDRIQNFSLKVSNNQVVGFVSIESEERSDLQEKSARDGLKENAAFFGLKEICQRVLRELETRRLTYRERTLKGHRRKSTLQETVNEVFNFETLTESIRSKLQVYKIPEKRISEVVSIIQNEALQKANLFEEIQKTIAIYQGQATLGKIVSFILHEGRKSIHFFKNETPLIKHFLTKYVTLKNEASLAELESSIAGVEKHGNLISELFKRINPLASQTRGKKSNFLIRDCIEDATQIFKETLRTERIDFLYDCPRDLTLYGWKNDLYVTLANLMENSIYWLKVSDAEPRRIEIHVNGDLKRILLTFKDNGPGLTDEEIRTEIIFEPGYSKKNGGTGLGLAIAGEAVDRLGGTLMALGSNNGAYFQIEVEVIQ